MTDQSLPQGEFEITETAQDVFRGLYALVGPSVFYFGVMWLGSLFAVSRSLAAGESPEGMALVFAALGLVVVLILSARAARHKERSSTIVLAEQSIAARREAGELTLPWATLTSARERGGMLVLAAGHASIMLPMYRMSAVQRASIRAGLEAHGIAERAATRKAKISSRGFAIWLFLILVFIAIYNTVNAP